MEVLRASTTVTIFWKNEEMLTRRFQIAYSTYFDYWQG
jgi:hypothetical protein